MKQMMEQNTHKQKKLAIKQANNQNIQAIKTNKTKQTS